VVDSCRSLLAAVSKACHCVFQFV